nr:hypothetical protein [Catenulispora acidiphila]
MLSLHVVAAIIAVGPVAVAASMFPRALRQASASEDPDAVTGLRLLHRVCRVYAGIAIAVPVFGFATASNMGVLGSAWLITAITLTAVAAAVLGLWILPAQQAALEEVTAVAASRLAAAAGVFNLLWATVTVLMIVRPGSTTGA